ncbi:MAG: hypothetical protein QM654_02265 [Dysgonamonadaceae bacterium]
MKIFIHFYLLFVTVSLFSQNQRPFTKLNFSENVFGDTSAFLFFPDSSIQMKAPSDTNRVSLSKKAESDFGTTWRIEVQMDVNPSNSNNIKFYILSDSVLLTKAANAYYVVIGNNADEVSLYSQTANSVTKVIDGLDKRLDKDTVRVEVIVSLDKDGQFALYSKRADEAAFYKEGTAQIKKNYKSTSYLGFVCTYSSKNRDKFTVKEVAIAYPEKQVDGDDDGDDPNTGVFDIMQTGFSLSARSFSTGDEPVYVQYKFPEAGYVARILSFDSSGNLIQELANNLMLEKKGRIQLVGNYEPGIVIVYAEAKTLDGKIIRKKLPIVYGKAQ